MVGRIGRFVLVAVATFFGVELIEFGTGTSIVQGTGVTIAVSVLNAVVLEAYEVLKSIEYWPFQIEPYRAYLVLFPLLVTLYLIARTVISGEFSDLWTIFPILGLFVLSVLYTLIEYDISIN